MKKTILILQDLYKQTSPQEILKEEALLFTAKTTLLEVSAIDIKLNNKLTTIVNIYDTDSKTTQSEYQQIFTQISDQFVVCGDFNAHHKLWGGGGGVNEMIQRATICITMLSKII